MTTNVSKAYADAHKSTADGRAAEAEAFARSASRLHQAAAPPFDADAVEAALASNQKLWTLLQASLSEQANPLSDELCQDILRLSIFVDKQTLKARAAPSMQAVQPLIDINRNMARGLFKKPD